MKCRVVAKPQQKGKEMGSLYIVCNSKKEEKEVLKKLEKQGYLWGSGVKPTKNHTHWPVSYAIGNKCYLIITSDGRISWTITKEDVKRKETTTAKEFLKECKECIVIYRNGAETIALEKNTGRKAVAKCHADDTYSFEIGAKLALNRLFPEPVREVSRYAEVGEYIKITNPVVAIGRYKKGDVFRVKEAFQLTGIKCQYVKCYEIGDAIIRHDEYVVLENYKPEEKPQQKQEQYYTGKVVCVRGNTGYTVGRIYEIKDGELKDDDGYIRPQGWHIKKLEDYKAVDFIELVE